MASREELLRRDEEDLSRLGYAQQLLREMGGFSTSRSLSVISVLTGRSFLRLRLSSPALSSTGRLADRPSSRGGRGEHGRAASLYPTAGGSTSGLPARRRGWAFTTAWFNMIGQVTITAGSASPRDLHHRHGHALAGSASRRLCSRLRHGTSWGFQLFVMVLILIPQSPSMSSASV